MKNIIIDGQLFQSNTWNRGMGKYSLDLLDSLAKNGFFDKYDRVGMIFSTELELNDEREELLKSIYNFDFIGAPLVKINRKSDIPASQLANKKIVEDVLSDNEMSGADFLILSLFEDEAASVFPDSSPHKMLLFYDVIPYLFAEEYLGAEESKKLYFGRFPVIFEADQIFTISQTTKNDLISFLGVDSKILHNIDGAPIRLQRKEVEPEKPEIIPDGKFILFPSGNDIRKNNERAIKAFSVFNQRFNNEYNLIVTSTFDDKTKDRLMKISPGVVFSGNVSESEISWLFNEAEAVLFPTLYEGLGLPILEAIESGTTPVCSDIHVFREMIDRNVLRFFDPYSVLDIAQALCDAVSIEFSSSHYELIVKKYTWERTATLFASAYKKVKPKTIEKNVKLKSLAVVCPSTNGLSTIARVIQSMHTELSRHYDITYYMEDNDSEMVRPQYLTFSANIKDVSAFDASEYRKYDHVIYHIGNSDYHCNTYWLAQRFPGYVVLHDTDLSGLGGKLVENGYMSNERMLLEDKLVEQLGAAGSKNTVTLLNSQLGVMVHSTFAKKEAEKAMIVDDIPVCRLNLPVPNPVEQIRNFDKESLTIGLAGILSSVKGLDVIKQLAQDPEFAHHQFNIFGFSFASSDSEMNELAALPNVAIKTDLSDFEFQTELANLDVFANYRPEYRGETSYSTLEAMRLGVVVLVRDIGWYSELDSRSVIKVKDEGEVKQALLQHINTPDKLQDKSEFAVKYITKKFTDASYVAGMIKVIEDDSVNNINTKVRDAYRSNAQVRAVKKWVSSRKD